MNQIFIYLFGTASLTTILIFLGKSIINKSLEAGLERYKLELSKETEEFKAGLRITELEHNVKFSKLHEQRADVLKDLYSKIITLQTNLSNYTTIFQGVEWVKDEGKKMAALKSLEDFKDSFLHNRILMPIELCEKIDIILDLSWGIIVDMIGAGAMRESAANGEERVFALDQWRAANAKVSQEFNAARLDLEREFRALFLA